MRTATARYCALCALVLTACAIPAPEEAATTESALPTDAFDLITQYQESFPKYTIENDSLGGLSFEILRQVERESQLSIGAPARVFTPFKRLQKHLASGEIDVFFGMKKNPARADQYHFS